MLWTIIRVAVAERFNCTLRVQLKTNIYGKIASYP